MNRTIQITRRHLASIGAAVVSFVALLPQVSFAIQGPGNVPIAKSINNLEEVFDFLKVIVQWFLVFGLLLAVAMIIWGGIKYVTAGGNSEKAGDGAKIVGYALLGVAVMVLAWALVNIVASFLGVSNVRSLD